MLPGFIQKMMDNNWLGDKTGQGFYKKVKSGGKSEILTLDLNTLEYKPKSKSRFASLDQVKNIENVKERIKILFNADDRAGKFYRQSFSSLFSYVSYRIPEIADEL
jgi:3-hydroxyacyl-CoA dehydrogenase